MESSEKIKTNDRLYRIWRQMKQRCTNENFNEYESYGGKGIAFDISWSNFENFINDMYESYSIHVEEFGEINTSLDRINSNENYCKYNCKWSTRVEQARNRCDNISIVVDGVEFRTISELAEYYNLSYQLVYGRYKTGKRDLELVAKSKYNRESINGIKVEIDDRIYFSLVSLQKDYSYLSYTTIRERYKKGKRGLELVEKLK